MILANALHFLRSRRALPLALVALCAACGSGGDAAGQAGAAAGAQSAGETQSERPAAFEEAELVALTRGLRAEIAAIQAARERGTAANTPEERGAAAQDEWDTATIPLGAQAAGLAVARYSQVRQTVNAVLTTLDFQGKIDGPLEIDLDNADAVTRARVATDAFAALDERSAAALRAQLDSVAAAWIDYLSLTAVNG